MPESVQQFAAVYTQHLGAVSRYLARRVDRVDVDDLAADVFAIAWRKRETVTAGEELPWLYRIASYQVANHRRRIASRASVLALFSVPDSAPSAESLVTADVELARAWALIAPRDREVLALVVLDDLSVSDAAVTLGITANAVSIRLYRAKKALAELLASDLSDGFERSASSAT
jgi:RNA polymerase sigma-70 factor (ECF subfamily)